MKKALTLKLIISFIITSLLYYKNISFASASVECVSVLITVMDSVSRNPISGATVYIVLTSGSTWEGSTNPSGILNTTFATPITVSELISVTEPRNYKPGSATLVPQGAGTKLCVATAMLAPKNPPNTCKRISGLVKDSKGTPLQGAGIYIDGNNIGISTDSEGEWLYSPGVAGFEITFPASFVKAVTAMGFWGSTSSIAVSADGNLTCTAAAIFIDTSSAEGPAADATDLMTKIQLISMGLGALIAVVRILLGAFKLMGGGDNPIALEEGRDMITSSILGLLVILFAVTLLRIIGSSVLGIFN